MAEIIPTAFDELEIAVVTGGPQTGADFSGLPFDHLLFTGAIREQLSRDLSCLRLRKGRTIHDAFLSGY